MTVFEITIRRCSRSCMPLLIMLVCLGLVACAGGTQRDTPLKARGFNLSDMVKGDIDQVAEITVQQSRGYLRLLALKLYRRNPEQLRRGGYVAEPEVVVSRLMSQPSRRMLAQWQGRRAAALISLGFEEDYTGDRVAALIYGLRSMLADAYGGEEDFYLYDQYDPQKIYFLARNIEIAAWRLKGLRDASGRPYLLSNGLDNEGTINASFERLIGKLIALQDHFAQIVAETTNRQIKNVIQGMASVVFFPI